MVLGKMPVMELSVHSTIKNRYMGKVTVPQDGTVNDIKKEIANQFQKLPENRQSLRSTSTGKDLKNDTTVESLKLEKAKIFVKDLGPQISWRLVFLCEYLGPVLVYLYFTTRPWLFYGEERPYWVFSTTASIAAICWTIHYVKRIFETIFVHRFSHSTMPMRNLFKNCGYYWGFTAYVAYHINHPLFRAPGWMQIFLGLGLFVVCELGNLSIHLLLRDLRPAGSTERKIPMPNGNQFTSLFHYVSCPNYTYEFGAWFGFSVMTSCFPALMFTLAGLFQMTIWALVKHRAYKKEFPNYPRHRGAILPFVL